MTAAVLATTIAGSLPKPAWLAQPATLWAPWLLPSELLAEGQRDAVLAALKEQEAAEIDIVTDGEQSRPHFVHGFLEQIQGIDFSRRVALGIRADRYTAQVPVVVGPVRRHRAIHADEVRWARAHTRRRLKFTIPGPMTIVDTIADEYYHDRPRLAMEFARIINAEARELVAAGLDVLQLDELAFNVYLDEVATWGIDALQQAIEGLACKTAVHVCYGYGIKANINWKASLGQEWRQYERILPVLAASMVDQVSVECAGSRVPIELLGLLSGKDVLTRVSGKWARCRSCGRRVRGRHPRQTSETIGAAAAQVGPRALALACSLHKEHGLSVRKTTATMRELRIRLSPGGLVQAVARIADRGRPTYQTLVEAVQRSSVVSGDETSWHVNGEGAWLWIKTTERVTVYGIREGRGYEEAASLLGADYRGVLGRDAWSVYRRFVEAEHQTCLARHRQVKETESVSDPQDDLTRSCEWKWSRSGCC